jgi:hypothetical protein
MKTGSNQESEQSPAILERKRSPAQSEGRLLQLQIQALQVTECGYKISSSKFIMEKPLK